MVETKKKIDKKYIIVDEIELVGDHTKNTNNFWYPKFIVFSKQFYQITKLKTVYKLDYIIYYCKFLNTTILSNKYDNKGKKNNKMKCKNIL